MFRRLWRRLTRTRRRLADRRAAHAPHVIYLHFPWLERRLRVRRA